MKWLFATGNPGKVREVAEILTPLGIELTHLGELDTDVDEPVEDGSSFEENARIKALGYARQLGLRCLAEDSGLEVDALQGRPGVYSARYAGTEGSRNERDLANNEKLLREMAEVADEQRSARFVSAVCVADPDGSVIAEARGTFEGSVARRARGENGFGYDPIFLVAEGGRTSAELTSDEKNARSHRGASIRRLAELLRQL